MRMDEQLIQAVTELNEKRVIQLVKEELKIGRDPDDLRQLIEAGMKKVGEIYEQGGYFIGDLIMAGVIYKEVLKTEGMTPPKSKAKNKAKIVVGTVEGDLHDIGKDIFICMLEASGFKVYDLGCDVPKERFIEKIKEVRPEIVGLSGIITPSLAAMREIVEALEAEGLRPQLKIIIGGHAVSQDASLMIGADHFTKSASEGVAQCEQWYKERMSAVERA
jgi:methanogenic corrinoid protein MtbC1